MGLDGRIGNKFLHAGPGYGGSCFPKDTSALARIGQEHAVPQSIVETVIRVNDAVKTRMIEKLRDLCDGAFNGRTVAVFGVMNGVTPHSGQEIGEFSFALRAKVRDGQVVLWHWFEDSFALSQAYHARA